MISEKELYIKPPKGVSLFNLPEIWQFRELFLVLTWRDIAVRYKQTALGVLWAILQPIVTMVVFTFIFNRVANIGSGDQTPYPIFLYVGLLFWQYYSTTLNNASNALVLNAAIVQKVYFPRLIIPITAATTSLVDLGIAAAVLVGLMLYYRFTVSLMGLVILPVLFVSAVFSSLGLGLFLCALNAKYRDVRYALPFFIQLLMYVTPIIYPVTMLDHHPVIKNLMLLLNPMSAIISNARAGLLGQGLIDWTWLWISLGMSFFYCLLGLWFFDRTERYFADIL